MHFLRKAYHILIVQDHYIVSISALHSGDIFNSKTSNQKHKKCGKHDIK